METCCPRPDPWQGISCVEGRRGVSLPLHVLPSPINYDQAAEDSLRSQQSQYSSWDRSFIFSPDEPTRRIVVEPLLIVADTSPTQPRQARGCPVKYTGFPHPT